MHGASPLPTRAPTGTGRGRQLPGIEANSQSRPLTVVARSPRKRTSLHSSDDAQRLMAAAAAQRDPKHNAAMLIEQSRSASAVLCANELGVAWPGHAGPDLSSSFLFPVPRADADVTNCNEGSAMIDRDRAKQFGARLLGIFTGSILTKLIDIGYQTGLFEASNLGPATCEELSERAGLRERYVREW